MLRCQFLFPTRPQLFNNERKQQGQGYRTTDKLQNKLQIHIGSDICPNSWLRYDSNPSGFLMYNL